MKNSFKYILWGYAFLLFAGVYIWGLFIDLTGDSGLYAAISKQMTESGDWLTLKINGELYDQKPHLLFWLAGIGIKLFGNTNFAFKIFPALWALAGVYFTYRLGKVLFSENAGRFAALVTATSQIFVLYLFDIHTDTVLQTGVVLALWQLVLYLKTNRAKHFILGFAGVGLAMLSKGPVGAVVPFFVVLFYLVFQKKYKQIFHPKWIPGILIALLVVSPALVHLYKSFGAEGIRFFFITNNFGRISGEYAGSSTDYFFYLHTIVWAFLPWTVFVVFALFSEIKSWFSAKEKDIRGIALLGSVMVFTGILSIAKGKAPNYFLLAVPVIAVITGKWTDIVFAAHNEQKLIRAQRIFLIVFLALFAFVGFMFRAEKGWLLFVLLFIMAAAGFASTLVIFGRFKRMVFISVAMTGSFNLFLNVSFIPNLFNYQAPPQALNIFQANKNPGDKLYNYHMEDYELFFYAKDTVRQIADWEEYYEIIGKGGSWLYTTKAGYDETVKYIDIDTVYFISHKGMNNLSLRFLNLSTREVSMDTTCLIQIN
ncbi:MAG: glycosyltransferase family 39 protein [Prolixibacteraceae bacterium]|nr:glycosyltransferase family 39 protein [Prolixibacteraceae bacterium]